MRCLHRLCRDRKPVCMLNVYCGVQKVYCYTVFDLISEHALISGHAPFFCIKKNLFFVLFIIFLFFILILIIISSDFREGNTSLLYTGLMATRALTLRVHLLGQNLKKKKKIYIYIFFGRGQTNLLSGLPAN